MRQFTTCSILAAIWCQLKTIDFSGCVLLRLGKRQRQYRRGLSDYSADLTVNLSVPKFELTCQYRERGMRGFKSMHQAQRFLAAHAAVSNLFNLGRHLVSVENYRYFRLRVFAFWGKAVAI